MTVAKRTDDVEVSVPDQEYDLTEEQEAFIEESIAQIDRGEYVTLDEVMRDVRALQAAEERKRR